MTNLINKLREELNQLVLNGTPLTSPFVLKKSEELDKLVTAYYREKYNSTGLENKKTFIIAK
ncbi:aspartyl-phosphate phosphatase Spo0E family protein [Bacillota bacterium LX-D]|nr:aspartyl-phosphate phosphatase Spo0E family protein [Bacillota bacterium LX-D]